MCTDRLRSCSLAGVTTHCVEQSRARIPELRELPYEDVTEEILTRVRAAVELDLVFPNFKDEKQRLVFVPFEDLEIWFVVGQNVNPVEGEWVVITPLVHKDKNEYQEYRRDVARRMESCLEGSA